GIVISEGIAAAIIKRLDDAERDGDRIHAILRSVGTSSDGRDKGLTAPRPIGQIRALERAYRKAGVAPETVGLMEAHGTGTVVGDRTEVESLSTFFQSASAAPGSCALGSVKSMVGHTKCTAGFAGLIKAVMALEHKVLPPTAGITQPNTKINFTSNPFYLNTETRPWFERADGAPRRAGVSAFGFGGTNFHAVLEEYRPADGLAPEQSALQDWPEELLLFRGASASEIADALQLVLTAIQEGARPLLSDLAAAVYWDNGRRAGEHCLALIAKSLDDVVEKIGAARPSIMEGKGLRDPRGIYYSPRAVQEGKIAFLFPGQGSQRVNMLLDLAMAFPCVRKTFEEADQALGTTLGQPVTRLIFPPPAFTNEGKTGQETTLRQTRAAQPALGAADIAMHRLLGELGIHPDMAAGHSYGEFAALCSAGAMSFPDLLAISEARGRLIVEAASDEPGIMAAIDGGEEAVRAGIAGLAGVCVANLNAPMQTVLSGTAAGVTEAVKRLAQAGLQGKLLPVSCAFHSPQVAGAREPLRQALGAISIGKPRFPVFANTTAAPHQGDGETIRDLLSEHLVKPVYFRDEMVAMHEAGARIFIECGPGRVLSGLAAQSLAQRSFHTVPTDQAGRNGLVQLAHTAGQLATLGVPLMAYRLYEGRVRKTLPLTSLLEQTRPKPLSATAWRITAGRAIPAAQGHPAGDSTAPDRTKATAGKHFLFASAGAANGTQAQPSPFLDGALPVPAKNGAGTRNIATAEQRPVAVASAAAPVSEAGAMVRQHRTLMVRMLQSHRRIMLTALAASPGAETADAELFGHVSPEIIPPTAPPLREAARVEIALSPAKTPEPVATSDPGKALAVPVVRGRDEITNKLLQLVANRTGYPIGMLQLGLDMEADLGIDSIKRVEIFGELQSIVALPAGGGENLIETLSSLKTLGAIVDFLAQRATGEVAAPEPPPISPARSLPPAALSGATPARTPDLTRFLATAVNAPALDRRPALAGQGLVLITDDGRGVALHLAMNLRRLGVASEIVQTGTLAARGTLPAAQGRVTALIHLQPLLPFSAAESPLQEGGGFEQRLAAEIKPLFQLSKELEQDLRAGSSGSVIVATAFGGSFAADGPEAGAFSPASGAVCGWVKTLGHEWPEVNCKAVDFEPEADVEEIAAALVSELASRDGLREVGYRQGRRLTLRSLPAPLRTSEPNALLTQDSVVLVTGGARGVTAEVALELARRFQPQMILVGRTPLSEAGEETELDSVPEGRELKARLISKLQRAGITPTPAQVEGEHGRVCREREIRGHLKAIAATGARVEYHAIDVGEATAFGDFLEGIYQRFGRLDGAIHGAGVIEDKLVRDKTGESFDRVMRPKVQGALTLCRGLRPEQLRFLAFFSSVSARYGNRGQGDYAAANEVLNKLAAWLNPRWPGRVVSFDWGPWETRNGMVTAELADRFAAAGVQMVSPVAGCEAFVRELESGHDAEVILGGPVPKKRAEREGLQTAARYPILRAVERIEWTDDRVEFLLHTDVERHVHLLDHQLDGIP
ncbi:MAG: SDR family NAD(P)-dependent oxidoreductase, partial [Acidobacteriota bacterium]